MEKTEEVLPQYEFAIKYQKNEKLYRSLSRPLRGHPPQRGGFFVFYASCEKCKYFLDFSQCLL